MPQLSIYFHFNFHSRMHRCAFVLLSLTLTLSHFFTTHKRHTKSKVKLKCRRQCYYAVNTDIFSVLPGTFASFALNCTLSLPLSPVLSVSLAHTRSVLGAGSGIAVPVGFYYYKDKEERAHLLHSCLYYISPATAFLLITM